MSKQTHCAHDKFVRTTLSNPRIAREFLNIYLPQELRNIVDLNSLSLQPRSHIDEIRKESIVDLLYKTRIEGQEGYLYLLVEHQSSPDELMPFRILKYTCNIMDYYLNTENKKNVPLIYPIVIYHNKRLYPYSTDIKDMINAPRKLIDQFFLQPFQLIDLGRIDDTELKNHAWVGVMEFMLKHIFAQDIMPHLEDVAAFMRKIVAAGGSDFVAIVLQYALEKGEMKDKTKFFNLVNNQISNKVGENLMTLAEQLREEGRLEGMLEGERKGLLEGERKGMLEGERKSMHRVVDRLLATGAELSFVARITGLSIEELKKYQSEKA